MIYLDHNASAPLHPAAARAMAPWLGPAQANASSAHSRGQAARAEIDAARRTLAAAVGAHPSEVVFTSSGTEADALGLVGPALARRSVSRRVVVSAIEHEAVLAASEWLVGLGFERVLVRPDASGRVDPERFLAAVGSEAAIAALIAASNETGVVQPVAEVARELRRRGIPLLADSVQVFGRLPLAVAELGADLVALSAHKVGGPQGVGALVVRRGTPLVPLFSGTQEAGRRAGTEAVAAIAGFAAVAAEIDRELAAGPAVAVRRDRLAAALTSAIPDAVVHGAGAPRLPNTLAIGFPAVDAAALVLALDLSGLAVSRGSACQSGAESPSHVLSAMAVAEPIARGTIRLSLGTETSDEDIARAMALIPPAVARARTASGKPAPVPAGAAAR